MTDAYLFSAVRTPIGKFGGALANHLPSDLGAEAMKAALDRAGISGDALDFFIMGHVLRAGHGQLVPRQAAFKAGIPRDVDGQAVDMVCSSGMMTVLNAASMIKAGDADVVLAGGMESMSTAGFYLSHKARWGYKFLGPGQEPLADIMQRDGLSDPETGDAMGDQTERLAAEHGITREELDAIAAESNRRAAQAHEDGRFADEIVPVDYRVKRDTNTLSHDEGVRPDTTMESLAGLRPAFKKDGVLTAGNASQISDGASALVVGSKEAGERLGMTPIARITGYGWAAGEPWRFPEAPIPALRKVLDKTGTEIGDYDLFENNEAFAINSILFERMLGVGQDKLNVHGGAIALGHPIGCSGARIMTTLIHALKTHDKERGIASICHGTGGGTAVAVELV
jgi:acetyl-CoA C-acetyltransferase